MEKKFIRQIFPKKVEETSPSEASSATTSDSNSIERMVEEIYHNTKLRRQGGGDGGGGSLESRVAKIESSVEYVQQTISDIKADLRYINETKLEQIAGKADTIFKWTVRLLVVILLAVLGLIIRIGWVGFVTIPKS